MAPIQTQVDAWRQSTIGQKGFLEVIKVNESSSQLTVRLHSSPLVITVPADADCMFEMECDAPALSELHAIVATYSFEQEDLTLAMLLDKIVTVYCKLFPNATPAAGGTASSSSSSAPAAVAASSSSAKPAKPVNDGSFMEDTDDADANGDADDGFGADATMSGDDDGFGEDGDGGEGWGDFKEQGADDEIHDEAWIKTQALKKRLIARAEVERVAAQHATENQKSGKDGVKTIFSSEAAVTMLVKDCMAFMASPDANLKVKPVNESVFQWNVQLAGFPSDSKLHAGLSELKSLYNYDHVELEVKFMPDLYPFFPPSVRLVRPRMKHFMIGRLVCMPELQLQQWNPTRTLNDIFDSIRRVLTSYGEIDDAEPEVNDPDSEMQPYTALEFELLRLTMLTGIAPRVVKTMNDADAMKLFVPKTKTKEQIAKEEKEAKEAAAKEAAAAAGITTSFGYYGGVATGGGFKKGTGYGGGNSRASEWDVEAWAAAQAKKESEIIEIAHALAMEMEKATVPRSLAQTLENSCLLPFLQQYLSNDSISDMEAHHVINHTILDICKHMAKHESLIHLFELLPGEKKSLLSYISDQKAGAVVVEKFEKFNPKGKEPDPEAIAASAPKNYNYYGGQQKTTKKLIAPDLYPIPLLKHILQVADIVDTAVAIWRSKKHTSGNDMTDIDTTKTAAAASSSSSSSSGGKSSAAAEVDYVATLSPYRFGEVDNFAVHHYFKTYGSTSTALSRAWVKRISTEYADLSKSLPIHPMSSTWLRYKEDAMAFCQFLIAAPDDTPYAQGLFLFDSYFPNTYPAGPPLVNLQTTGAGTVRFNPNLYHCGKVCLSLLGTWSGAAGENWNPQTSTFLQVIVSIQSLILVPEPYFNEPGYQNSYGTPQGKTQSDAYNKVIEIGTIRFAMIEMIKKPPAWAKDIVRSHFTLHRDTIMKTCRQWAEHNPGVKALLSDLQSALDSCSLPDGSRPVLVPPPTIAKSASSSKPAAAAAAASSTTSPTSSTTAAAAAASSTTPVAAAASSTPPPQ